MRVTEHIEQLLRQGWKQKELVELGFPKPRVTMVARRLRSKKAAARAKVSNGEACTKSYSQPEVVSASRTAPVQQKQVYQESDLQKADNLLEALPELMALVAAARELGTHRREKCPYQEDGVCVRQTWTSREEMPQAMGEPVFLVLEEEEPRWCVRPSDFYCAMCTRLLEDCMADVESNLLADPLSGAKDQITCETCGSKGFIAAPIECTKCERET